MAWIDKVRKTLRKAEQICAGVAGTRNALLGLWLAIDRAPSNVRDLFRGFDEQTLQREASDLPFYEIFHGVPDAARTRAENEAVLWALAVRLRALELFLFSMIDGAPVRRPVKLGKNLHFVDPKHIPCRQRFLP